MTADRSRGTGSHSSFRVPSFHHFTSRRTRLMFKGTEFRMSTRVIATGLGLALLVGPVAARLSAAEPDYRLRLVTDRPEAIYQVGETANFLISVTQGEAPVASGEVTYEVDE